MQLQRVALSNFRNYAELDIEPATGLNVFVGANAQGKSNLLEAIAMLGTGKSFRTSKDADLVRDGLELARRRAARRACGPASSISAARLLKRPRGYAQNLHAQRAMAFATRAFSGSCAS